MMRSWLDLRSLGLAVLLAVAAALPQFLNTNPHREYFFFDVTLTSSAIGSTQLFWDIGQGYNETDSSRQPLRVEPEPVVYRYMMPMGPMRALRFDPVDGMGKFTLTNARIVDHKGRVVREFAPADFVPEQQIARHLVRGDTLEVEAAQGASDPVLSLRLNQPLVLQPAFAVRWNLAGRTFLTVLAIGALVSLPAVARRLQAIALHLAAILAARPLTALALTGAVAVAIHSHPVLFQGRSYVSPANGSLMLYGDLPTLPGDQSTQFANTMASDTGALLFQHLYYPMVQRDALSHGEWPLWNRYSLCGEPLLGQGQSMFGDPFNFLTIAADSAAWSWDVRFLLARWIFAFALGVCVWRLTRHLGAALLVTLSSAFIGFYTYRIIHPSNFSVCYAPLLLLAWIVFLQAPTPRKQAFGLLGLLAAHWLVLTSGTVKEAYMMMAGMDLAGLALLALLPEAAGRHWRLLGLASAAGAVFLLISTPVWLTFLTTWKHSFTSYDQPHAYALTLSHVIGFFDDMFYRQTVKDENILAPSLNFLLMLGILWWLTHPGLWFRQRAGAALALAAVPPLCLAFAIVPIPVILKIPFINNIGHLGNTFSSVLLPLGAVLGGCGFAAALPRLREAGWWNGVARIAVALAILATLYFATSTQFPKSQFFTAYVIAALLGLLALLLGPRWADARRPGLLWVALLVGLPLLHWRHTLFAETELSRYAFTPGRRADLHATSATATALDRMRTAPGRVVGWGNNLFPSYNTALRWESLYGVDAVRNQYYQEFAQAFGLERVWIWDALNRESDAARLFPAHDVLNVTHYLGTRREPPLLIPGIDLIDRQDLELYARPAAWPRAFFTDRLRTYTTPDEFAALVRSGDGRPFAAIPAGDPAQTGWPAGSGGTITPAREYQLTPNGTAFTVTASGPGVAVLTETYYAEDFRVTVNGQPQPCFRVNHAFRGIRLPAAGTYRISYKYWPEHFTLSLWLSAAGLLLAAAGWWRLARSRTAEGPA